MRPKRGAKNAYDTFITLTQAVKDKASNNNDQEGENSDLGQEYYQKTEEPINQDANGNTVEIVYSDREGIIKSIRNRLYNTSGEGSISPVLPIEIDLSIYGNRYLQIGDCFTVNYLPKHYKDRTFFQIVGIEDSVDVNGWTTSYTSVMRVDPSSNKFLTSVKKTPDPPGTPPPTTEDEEKGDGSGVTILKKKDMILKENPSGADNLTGTTDERVDSILSLVADGDVGTSTDDTGPSLEETLENIAELTKKNYERRMRDADLSYRQDDGGLYTANYAENTAAIDARKKTYTYTWFRGPNGEEVKMNSRGVKFYKLMNEPGVNIDRNKIIPDPELKFTVSGETLYDPTGNPQFPSAPRAEMNKHGKGKLHPAYSQFSRASQSRPSASTQFKIQMIPFEGVDDATVNKTPLILYHKYEIPFESLGQNTDNIAMMYAIQTALANNINFENIKVVNEDNLTSNSGKNGEDVIISFHDTGKVLKEYSMYYETVRAGRPDVDKRIRAVAEAIKRVVKPNEYSELLPEGQMVSPPITAGFLSTVAPIEGVPKMMSCIRFRDGNKPTPLLSTGTYDKEEANIVFSMRVNTSSSPTFKSGLGISRMQTNMLIPRFLIEKSETSIEQIANDINRLYAGYRAALKSAADSVRRRNLIDQSTNRLSF